MPTRELTEILTSTDTLDGDGNLAIGEDALSDITSGVDNIGIGDSAGTQISSGIGNICIGLDAGVNITTGTANIVIGPQQSPASGTANAQVVIGQWLRGAGQFSNSGWHFNGGTPVRPNIDMTPTAQEIVDALVALGLVTQS